MKGNVFRELLIHGENISDQNENGDTPLHILIVTPDLKDDDLIDFLKSALDEAAHLRTALLAKNSRGDTFFRLLSRFFIRSGILHDVTCTLVSILDICNSQVISDPNCDTLSPLHLAARSKNDLILRIFIMFSPNLNIQDNRGRTPLHYAIEAGCHLCVRSLVRSGADVSIMDLEGVTPLDLASSHSNDSIKSALNPSPCGVSASLLSQIVTHDPPYLYRCLWQFEGDSEVEVSVKKNEIVSLLLEITNGWCLVEGRERGFIPLTHIIQLTRGTSQPKVSGGRRKEGWRGRIERNCFVGSEFSKFTYVYISLSLALSFSLFLRYPSDILWTTSSWSPAASSTPSSSQVLLFSHLCSSSHRTPITPFCSHSLFLLLIRLFSLSHAQNFLCYP